MEQTPEFKAFQNLIKEFVEKEVKPLAAEIDEQERFPEETVAKMGKLGMMGIIVPKEYGGIGGDVLTYAMAVEEMSKVCATTGVILSAHTSLCVDPILHFGTEDQKKKYLPDLLNKFENLTDLRHKSYITYNMKTICVTRLFGLICGLKSLSNISSDEFNTDICIKNISSICNTNLTELPYWETIQNVFIILIYKK